MPSRRPSSQLNELHFSASSPERTDVLKTVNDLWADPLRHRGRPCLAPSAPLARNSRSALSWLSSAIPLAAKGDLEACPPEETSSGMWHCEFVRSVLWFIVQLDHYDFFVGDEREVARPCKAAVTCPRTCRAPGDVSALG